MRGSKCAFCDEVGLRLSAARKAIWLSKTYLCVDHIPVSEDGSLPELKPHGLLEAALVLSSPSLLPPKRALKRRDFVPLGTSPTDEIHGHLTDCLRLR